jgi:alkylation response protein AidB-like acyl-CoA dehydrogenase
MLTGQKTMTTAAHHLNWIIIAARTDPEAHRHKGISYFLIPMDAPGIELQALYSLAGGRQNLTFLNEVRVPENRLLGDVNQGWNQIWFGLGGNPVPAYEEDDPGPETEYEPPLTEDTYGVGSWLLDQLVRYCRTTIRNGAPLSEDPVVRMQLAELAIGTEIGKMMDWEGPCEYGGSAHQVVTKEFVPRFAQTCMEILGPLAQIQGGPWAPLADKVEWMYRRSHVVHGGGTPQVRRMVVATRTLGLPR